MSYYQFTAEYVLKCGGATECHETFLKYATIAAPNRNIDSGIYLYKPESREVYISDELYQTICKRFAKFKRYLVPKSLTYTTIKLPPVAKISVLLRHFETIISDVEWHEYKKCGEDKTRGVGLYCAKTKARLLSVKYGCLDIRIYNSKSLQRICEAVMRYNLMVEKGRITYDSSRKDDLEILNLYYNRKSNPDLETIRLIKWAILNYSGPELNISREQYYLRFKYLSKKYTIEEALRRMYGSESTLDDVCATLNHINKTIGSKYSVRAD